MATEFEIGGRRIPAETARRGEVLRLEIEGRTHEAELRPLGGGEFLLTLDGRRRRVWLARDGDGVHLHMDGRSWTVRTLDGRKGSSGSGGSAREDVAIAPMPGTVLAVHAAEGESVHMGQTLIVIESMKMETPINAWRDGVIAKIHHGVGDTFDRNVLLVTLAPAEE